MGAAELDRALREEMMEHRPSKREIFTATCILAARTVNKDGDELARQQPTDARSQQPLMANAASEEQLQYLVSWREEQFRDTPEWISAGQVGLPLIRGFHRLLEGPSRAGMIQLSGRMEAWCRLRRCSLTVCSFQRRRCPC